MSEENEKWSCMTDYCKKNNLPPAQSWAWNKALKEYVTLIKKNKT